MTIYRNLLARGYFPKELPPNFFTEHFARYATSKRGRALLKSYKPANGYTECFSYSLALPNLERRQLLTPHPYSFALLANLGSKHFRRLLKKAASSTFSKSRPVYKTGRHRAIHPMLTPSNQGRERASLRGGSRYLLKVDVNQFYPSLYTHAVGWAIDPKLRDKLYWRSKKLLGKLVDQALMDLQGKISQGIPIGNDLSFLLAEIVLAQVDRKLMVKPNRSYRWFDDYELACDSRDQAEELLARLRRELGKFRLRINPKKTRIIALPTAAQEEWQQVLRDQSETNLNIAHNMVQYFDSAFRLREEFSDSPVLMYALGILFRVRVPTINSGRVALSAISQTILAEPGAAQKAFSLLTFWSLNGFQLDVDLLAQTIEQMILRHRTSGVSSDISWALSFAIENRIKLGDRAGKTLSGFEDDCLAIQSLHAHNLGLLPKGFSTKRLSALLKGVDLDGEHWLLGYEAVRQGYLHDSAAAISRNALFSDLLRSKITFYRTKLPAYANVIHPGGAPEWAVKQWIEFLQKKPEETAQRLFKYRFPTLALMEKDFQQVVQKEISVDDTISELIDTLEPKPEGLIADDTQYGF